MQQIVYSQESIKSTENIVVNAPADACNNVNTFFNNIDFFYNAASSAISSTSSLHVSNWITKISGPYILNTTNLSCVVKHKNFSFDVTTANRVNSSNYIYNNFNIGLAYKIQIEDRKSISFGVNSTINTFRFQRGNGFKFFPSFGAGVYYNSDYFKFGVSSPSLLILNDDFTVNSFFTEGVTLLNMNTMLKIPISKSFQLRPEVNGVIYNDFRGRTLNLTHSLTMVLRNEAWVGFRGAAFKKLYDYQSGNPRFMLKYLGVYVGGLAKNKFQLSFNFDFIQREYYQSATNEIEKEIVFWGAGIFTTYHFH
jgi:hypothetical protein